MIYANGKIYKITNTVNDEVYIGSTCKTLQERFSNHMRSCRCDPQKAHYPLYKMMKEFGAEKFFIELVQEAPCESLEQLLKVEGEYIRKYATLNGRIAGRTTKEWTDDNKDKKKEMDKAYREQNAEHVAEYKKAWREENRERIKIMKQQYYQQHKEEINQKVRDRYREKAQEKQQQHKEQIKTSTTVPCECGLSYTRSHKSCHYKTKIHAQRMEELQRAQAQTTDS
jgi:group I intron endonuclease